MDEKDFISFMKKQKKTERTINACIEGVKELEAYLESDQKALSSATSKDLESFVQDYAYKKRVSKLMWALSSYFDFIGNKSLLKTANRIRSGNIRAARRPFKLKDFRGVHPKHIAALASINVNDTEKLLELGRTPKSRATLASESGLQIKVIEELVKLSDLSRIPGVKGIRARLYHDAGFDRLEKIRSVSPEELLRIASEFVMRTGFDGIAPLPKEVQYTIETANKLPDLIEW